MLPVIERGDRDGVVGMDFHPVDILVPELRPDIGRELHRPGLGRDVDRLVSEEDPVPVSKNLDSRNPVGGRVLGGEPEPVEPVPLRVGNHPVVPGGPLEEELAEGLRFSVAVRELELKSGTSC
ncbi:MAG: hypothetical protein MZV64_30485 [Ignavibacteriales bacterium]|nr:hypothetical protein [Ignavibacteriales bacterium]